MKSYSEQSMFADHIPASNPHDALEYFYSHAYHDMRFFLKAITQNDSNSCVFFGDIQQQLYYISDNLKNLFGFPDNLMQNFFHHWIQRIHGNKWKTIFATELKNAITRKQDLIDLRQQVTDRDGNVIWVRFYGAIQWSPYRDKPLFFACRISRQDQLFAVDPITNFPTAGTLQRYLSQGTDYDSRYTAIGFCYNYIPQINTMYGRNLANRLIEQTSRQLTGHFAERLSFYRLPGVRCLTVINSADNLDPMDVLQQIRKIIGQQYQSFGILVPKPCSFALMHIRKSNISADNFQETMVSLLKMARRDLEAPYLEDSALNLERIHKRSDMEMTVKQDVLTGMRNFRPVIQPVVSAKTGKIVGGEMLMRWKYEGRDVSPATFIPVLESDNMINIAGRWILEKAVKACKQITSFIPDFYLSVNVSLQQLRDPELLRFIPAVLKKYDLDGSHLVLETTESCLDRDSAAVQTFVDTCHNLGVRIALDDFGTGYSSLRVLLKYSTDIIKLDRSLLLEMSESEEKYNFITSIVFACHQFRKTVCVEGVETAAHRNLVDHACCDTIQGFYYYRPAELDEVYELAQHGDSVIPSQTQNVHS